MLHVSNKHIYIYSLEKMGGGGGGGSKVLNFCTSVISHSNKGEHCHPKLAVH